MVTLHSDKELAICLVRDRVQSNLTEREMSITTRASPTHSHDSNGGAERAVQSVRGLGSNGGSTSGIPHRAHFGADSPLWLWAFRRAGWILTRFGRRRDTGMTSHVLQTVPTTVADVCGRSDRSETWSADLQTAQINKLECLWLEGLWVGRDGSTDEHLVASGGGIVRCRAVKRMTDGRRWLAARFGSFQWTPWAPSAVQRGRRPKACEDAEPIRMGALGHEHLLMALLPEHQQQQHQLQLQSHQCRSPRRRVLHSPVRLHLLRRLLLLHRLQQCQSRKRR